MQEFSVCSGVYFAVVTYLVSWGLSDFAVAVGRPSKSSRAATKSSLCFSRFLSRLFSSHSNTAIILYVLYIQNKKKRLQLMQKKQYIADK